MNNYLPQISFRKIVSVLVLSPRENEFFWVRALRIYPLIGYTDAIECEISTSVLILALFVAWIFFFQSAFMNFENQLHM
jgi:hypothetical protein